MGKKCLKCPKCLKLKNINAGVLEKWSDGVLGLNHYSSTPMLHYSKLLSEPFDPFDELRAGRLRDFV